MKPETLLTSREQLGSKFVKVPVDLLAADIQLQLNTLSAKLKAKEEFLGEVQRVKMLLDELQQTQNEQIYVS